MEQNDAIWMSKDKKVRVWISLKGLNVMWQFQNQYLGFSLIKPESLTGISRPLKKMFPETLRIVITSLISEKLSPLDRWNASGSQMPFGWRQKVETVPLKNWTDKLLMNL